MTVRETPVMKRNIQAGDDLTGVADCVFDASLWCEHLT
jgi:hypothetical protein